MAARTFSLRCRGSGTFRIRIIFDMLLALSHVLHMSSPAVYTHPDDDDRADRTDPGRDRAGRRPRPTPGRRRLRGDPPGPRAARRPPLSGPAPRRSGAARLLAALWVHPAHADRLPRTRHAGGRDPLE